MAKQLKRVPMMGRTHTDPVPYSRTKRPHIWGGMMTAPAGKLVPVCYAPLFREDQASGYIELTTEMMETHELLANKTYGRFTAYFIPFLALERFGGSRDLFDKSYMGEPLQEGDDVVPWIETQAGGTHGSNLVYKYLGIHYGETDPLNTAVLECYNKVWNFRAENRSKDITHRDRLEETFAPAFWERGRFADVVPDFDQAVIDGEVALNVVPETMRVRGIGKVDNGITTNNGTFRESTGEVVQYENSARIDNTVAAGQFEIGMQGGFPDIFVEMQQKGITVSLSEIHRAKEMTSFAKLRERYTGHSDEYIINMLMDGIHIPELDGKQPILVADELVDFRQSKRYATDGANLAKSAVSGGQKVRLPIHIPRANTGGIVMVFAEFFPAQMFERQRDPWMHTTAVDQLPEAMRDYLDPEKVDIVTNGEVDTDHNDPDSTFGYAPQHWKWFSWPIQNGGEFYRPAVDGTNDAIRQRFWPVETANPTLGETFYLVPTLPTVPFLDTDSDPFQINKNGGLVITGNTQPGGKLHEAQDNYDAVDARADGGRIDKEQA